MDTCVLSTFWLLLKSRGSQTAGIRSKRLWPKILSGSFLHSTHHNSWLFLFIGILFFSQAWMLRLCLFCLSLHTLWLGPQVFLRVFLVNVLKNSYNKSISYNLIISCRANLIMCIFLGPSFCCRSPCSLDWGRLFLLQPVTVPFHPWCTTRTGRLSKDGVQSVALSLTTRDSVFYRIVVPWVQVFICCSRLWSRECQRLAFEDIEYSVLNKVTFSYHYWIKLNWCKWNENIYSGYRI